MYNHLKESDSNTLHNKALTHREVHPEKCLLSLLVLGICPTHNNQHIRQNQIIGKQKEKYLAHWKESTKKQSKLACYLSLNRACAVSEYLTSVTYPKLRKPLTRYRLTEQSLAIEKGHQRQIWLQREHRLCPQTNWKLSCTS